MACQFCIRPREVATLTPIPGYEGVVEAADGRLFLLAPGGQVTTCEGHLYCDGALAAAVRFHGSYVAGRQVRVGGRTAEGHPFYAWLPVPRGWSPAAAARECFPGAEVGPLGDSLALSESPLD